MTTGKHTMAPDVDGKIAALKITGGGVGIVWYSLTLNEWVAVLTIVYLALQIILLLPKYCEWVRNIFRRFRDDRSVL